jgi:hypothetical protein
MTELLTRPPAAADQSADVDGPSVWWRGALSALWAVSLGLASVLVVVLVGWAADSRASAGATSATRTAMQLWLVAHRVPLAISGGHVAIAPLLLTLGLGFLVARAAAVLARGHGVADGNGVAVVALAIGLPYAGLAVFVAAAGGTPQVRPSPAAALVAGLLFGCGAAAWGAARGAGVVRSGWERLPAAVRVPAGAGLAATAVLLVGSALLLVGSVLVHGGAAVDDMHLLGGGGVGAALLVLLDLALLPNAAVCALGYLSGPGFAIGADTSVRMTGSHVPSMPALPLLAAVPRGAAGPVVELSAVVVLVAAGVVAAWLVARAGQPLSASMAYAAGAGATAGVVVAVLAALSGGPAGPGAMSVVGVSPWQAGLAITFEVAIVSTGAAGALTWRRGR